MGKDSEHEFRSVSTSCRNDCCKARCINGGRKGAVVDQHGGDGTEMEAENRCVGSGRIFGIGLQRGERHTEDMMILVLAKVVRQDDFRRRR